MKMFEYLKRPVSYMPSRAGLLAWAAYGATAGAGICISLPSRSLISILLLISYLLIGFILDSIDKEQHLSDIEQGVRA